MLILYVGCIKFFTNRFVKNFCPVLNITFLAYIIFLFSPRVKNIYKNYLFMFKDNYKLLFFFFKMLSTSQCFGVKCLSKST